MELFNIYKKIGFSPISASITEYLNDNGETKKKFIPLVKGWGNEQEFNEKNLDSKKNGVFLVMGVKLEDGKYLLGFDVDNKDSKDGCKNGMIKWQELIKENNFIVDTPYATTGNKGLHLLFKITEQEFNNTPLSTNITDLIINKEKFTIDVKCKGGCLITEPTKYKAVDGTIKAYKWIVRPSTADKIQDLPDFLKDIFFKYQIKEDLETIKSNKPLNTNLKELNYPKIEITKDDYKLINLIPSHHFNDVKAWRKMIWIFKSLNLPFEEFVKLSSQSAKFQGIQDCWNWWKCCKNTTDKINIGLIHALVKKENPEEYFKLNLNYITEDDSKEDVIEMNKLYLLDLDNDNLDKVEDPLTNIINGFFKDDTKSFNLKSPYDTGKTKLIQKVIKKFKPERILWLSYRKTLTNDILGSFGEEFDFKDYQEGDFTADRLIIQLESILKIEGVVFEGSVIIPSYDLVIIDEVESILAQFNSTTFKGLSKESFEYIEAILHNSKKLITLDGDLGNRTYKYIKSFGKCLNVVNTVKKNKKIFNFTDNTTKYNESIRQDILSGLKIVIVSMSSSKCNEYKDFINGVKKGLNILVYTGSSSDYLKNELKNVLGNWKEADVLIYSPTIEAGVNFDLPHFDKIYGLICDKSTTPRAFLQMLARVRKTTDNNILIYNDSFKYNKMTNKDYYNYNEVKDLLISFEDIKITSEIKFIDGKMTKISGLKPYDVNYIYNKLEHLNANKYSFLPYLMRLMTNKGHIVKINNITEEEREEEKFLKTNLIEQGLIEEEEEETGGNSKEILDADDIDDETYDKLMKKQKASIATEDEKLLIKKHSYKKKLGVDRLNDALMDKYIFKERIDRFLYLIDEKNIPDFQDNQTKEHRERVRMLKSAVEDLGFKNIFDSKTIITREQLEENIFVVQQTNPIFTDFKRTKTLFNIHKNKEVKTTRAFLGFFNSLLEDYCFKIQYKEKSIKGKKEPVYNIIELDGANELLEYKIKRGMKITDTDKIRPKVDCKQWVDLIDLDKIKEKQNIKKIAKITTWMGTEEEENFIAEPTKKIIKIKVKNNCLGCGKVLNLCGCNKLKPITEKILIKKNELYIKQCIEPEPKLPDGEIINYITGY